MTLNVSGPAGNSSAAITYTVNPAAQPPQPQFNANPPDGTVGEAVQFTDLSSGEITGYQWDFGDGSPVSNDQNPSHTFGAAGTYPVTLTVSGPGGSNAITVNYVVNDAAPPPPSIVEQLPVLPNLNQVQGQLQNMFNSDNSRGARASVFAVIGGTMAVQPGYLDPFADTRPG